MPVVQDEISLVKVADGRGILGTPVSTYAQSTSGTNPPTTWSATRPNVTAGQYLWTRVVTTYTDNTTSETQTPTLMGKPGESGLGIKEKSISYAVGTSGNTPPTTGWQETIPTVAANQYFWTRTTLVYTDDSKTDAYSVGKMGANGADAQLLYLTASAENMAFNADDTPKTTQTINISAKLQNVTGTATFVAIPYIGNTAQPAITLGGSGNTRTLTSAQWTNKNWTLIAITATLDNLNDTLSIVKVKDGAKGPTGADGKPSYTHTAYAWSADGKDRFTTTYPNENLLEDSISMSSFSTGILTENAYLDTFNSRKNTRTVATQTSAIVVGQKVITELLKPSTTYTVSFVARGNYVRTYVHPSVNAKATGSQGQSTTSVDTFMDWTLTSDWQEYTYTFTTLATLTGAKHLLFRLDNKSIDTNAEVARVKVEKSPTMTPYTPSPSEDFANAYPTYAGTYVDDQPTASTDPADYTWQRILGQGGEDGKDGDSAPLISLSGATQAITVDKDGKITPASSFAVNGTAVNTTISNWTYSLNGGNFGSALPTGVTRSGNVVTVNPTTSTFNQLTIKASDGTVNDVFTISRITDGGDGTPGADAYTVFLTNESYTFAGSTSAALAGSTTTEIVVYKGINKITPTSITVGTRPTGLTSSVSGSVVTFTAATSLVTKSGTVPITIVADGKTFTKQFAYALSLQGGKGDPGENGVSVTGTQVQYVQTSSMTEPTSGWVTTRPTPVPGQWLWTRSRNILSNGTYGAWATVPTLIGREAIVVSATAPSNPTTGTLWQIPTDPNVQKWDGTKWVDWGISVDNLVAENAVIKDGKFETLEGVTIKAGTVDGGKFTSSFQRDTWTGSAQAKKGTIQIEGGYIDLIYDLIQKSDSTVMSKGGYTLDENGFIIYTNDIEGGLLKNTQYADDGIYMTDVNLRDYGTGKLSFQDLVKKDAVGCAPASGYSQYSTTTTSANYPRADRIGRIVNLSGAFTNNASVTSSATEVVMGYVPEFARPTIDQRFVVQGSSMNRFLLVITAAGEIMHARYGTSAYATIPAGAWLNISCVYAAADM